MEQHEIETLRDKVPCAAVLEREGWTVCLTGNDNAGDQEIYTRPDRRLTVSIDISYWAMRRLRLFPQWQKPKPAC